MCGSHGKTTTTAMLVTALRRAGFSAGYVLGGLFGDSTPPAGTGSSDWVVAEIDESDGTIDCFSPEIAVVVNLDWDHPDRYRTASEIEAAFRALASRTRGTVLVSDACPLSLRLCPSAVTFGRSGLHRYGRAPRTATRPESGVGRPFPFPRGVGPGEREFHAVARGGGPRGGPSDGRPFVFPAPWRLSRRQAQAGGLGPGWQASSSWRTMPIIPPRSGRS